MISVIVPVYNVEKYLDECVQSILWQTYKDFELVLVDDGSTDNSGRMCDDYTKIDKRIKVIHKENGGLSDARNKGMEEAKGKYITYIDSDDFVSTDYLETLWKMIEEYEADISVTKIQRFFDGDTPQIERKNVQRVCFSGIEALENVLYQRMMDTSACAILLRYDIARNNPFPYGKYHEDDFTTYKFYLEASKVAFISKPQYFYRQRSTSIMHSFGKAAIDELEASDNLVDAVSNLGDSLLKASLAKKFSNYCQIYLQNEFSGEELMTQNRIENYLTSSCKQILFDRSARKKNRIAALVIYIFGIKVFGIFGKCVRKV